MDKEKEEEVRHELDNAFSSLRDLIYAPVLSSLRSGVDAPTAEVPSDPLNNLVPQDNDYDQRVRELAFEKRAKPKDRTKTEEELAMEEKEALEKAERKRVKRMQGLEDSDSDEDERPRKGKRKHGEGDDLDDDFAGESDDDWAGIGTGLGESPAPGEESDDADEDEEDDSGEEEEGDHESASDDEEASGELSDVEELTTAQSATRKTVKPPPTKELPYTFACPASHEEFLDTVEDIADADVPTVVQRIRTLHHTSLAPENKFKLQVST